MSWPAVTSSPWLTWAVKPSPFNATVSRPEVDEYADVVGRHDDVGVRHQFQQLAADRGDRLDHPARRVDRGAVAHHALGEHWVGNVLEPNRTPRDRGENLRRAHVGLLVVRTNNTSVAAKTVLDFARFSSKLPLSFGGGGVAAEEGDRQ